MVWLLPIGKRRVVVGPVPHALGHEEVARHHPDGAQHGEIADALLPKGLDELAAIAAVAVALPYPSSDHPRTVSSSE